MTISRLLKFGCLASLCLQSVWAADCADRQPGKHLEYLGRSADNTASFWLSATSAGSYRLSAPVGGTFDAWSTAGNGLRLSASSNVLNDLNGIHKLDRMNSDGSFDCFLDSRGQTNPLFPTIPPVGGGGGGGGGSGGGDIVASINLGSLATYQAGFMSISDRIVVGLDWRERFPKAQEGWQTWGDMRHSGLADDRGGSDASGQANAMLFGVHRAIGPRTVLGLATAYNNTHYEAFSGTLGNQGESVFLGPYLGYRLSADWVTDAWLAWGRTDNAMQLDVLRGDYASESWLASANLTGRIERSGYLIRPKLELFYNHSVSDAFALAGQLPYGGQIYNVTLNVGRDSSEYATSEASVEVSRPLCTCKKWRLIPSLRAGVRYDIVRPNDGDILDDSLNTVDTTPWSGSLRVGLAAEPDRSLRFELLGGYYSIGRSDLDVWDVRLNAALSF